MQQTIKPGYRRLVFATDLFIYLLIVVGAVVRVTGSGLGCPDWPTCYGNWIPPLELTAIVEYTHRTVAAVGGVLIVLTALLAWLRYRQRRWVVVPASLVIGLLVLQVPLGAVVVLTELEPALVAFHLGMALLIFGIALAVGVEVTRPAEGLVTASSTQRTRLIVTLAALFVLLMTGAVVVGGNASFACPNWPLCNNSFGLLPPGNSSPLIWIHYIHRLSVVAFTILFVWMLVVTLRERESAPAVRLWLWIASGLLLAQIIIGAVQVWLHKPPVLQALHVAVASGVWAALVIALLLGVRGAKPG